MNISIYSSILWNKYSTLRRLIKFYEIDNNTYQKCLILNLVISYLKQWTGVHLRYKLNPYQECVLDECASRVLLEFPLFRPLSVGYYNTETWERIRVRPITFISSYFHTYQLKIWLVNYIWISGGKRVCVIWICDFMFTIGVVLVYCSFGVVHLLRIIHSHLINQNEFGVFYHIIARSLINEHGIFSWLYLRPKSIS
jgi:hypothetical protein